VTLNSLIAATLLFEQTDVMKMSDLLEITKIIYSYVKMKRNTMTYMQVKPQQMLVEKHLEGLGVKMKDKGKKTCQILINHKA
jgi:predicted transcriptional regulator